MAPPGQEGCSNWKMHSSKSLSRRERVARVSGPGEGYNFCTPHPPLRGTLSLRERDSQIHEYKPILHIAKR